MKYALLVGAFLAVTLPLSVPGILIAVALVFIAGLRRHDVLGVAGTKQIKGGAWHFAGHPHLFGQVAMPAATGLVVNQRVNLPRSTRRLIRAMQHRRSQGRLDVEGERRLRGLEALQAMVVKQREQ